MKLLSLSASLVFAATAAVPQIATAQTQVVDLELALLIDASGSVDTAEFNLQRQGYVNAFNSSAIQGAFATGRTAAVTFIYWSGSTQQNQAVGWTLINSASSSSAFASAIAATTRPFNGGTEIGSALAFATPLFSSNLFDGARQVIDVSGDGTSGVTSTVNARDAALAAGIDQINGLPILDGNSSLFTFYQTNVQGGVGAFTIAADTFTDFSAAVEQKIGREIIIPPVEAAVPEPETWAMMIIGFGMVGGTLRGRQAKKSQVFA